MTSYVLVFYFANKYTDRHNKYICVFGAFTNCKKSVHCLRAEPAFGVYLRLFACGISNNLLGALIGLKVCAKSWLGEGVCTSRSINAQICTYNHTYRDISMYVFVSFFFLFEFLGLPNIYTQMPRIVRQSFPRIIMEQSLPASLSLSPSLIVQVAAASAVWLRSTSCGSLLLIYQSNFTRDLDTFGACVLVSKSWPKRPQRRRRRHRNSDFKWTEPQIKSQIAKKINKIIAISLVWELSALLCDRKTTQIVIN